MYYICLVGFSINQIGWLIFALARSRTDERTTDARGAERTGERATGGLTAPTSFGCERELYTEQMNDFGVHQCTDGRDTTGNIARTRVDAWG